MTTEYERRQDNLRMTISESATRAGRLPVWDDCRLEGPRSRVFLQSSIVNRKSSIPRTLVRRLTSDCGKIPMKNLKKKRANKRLKLITCCKPKCYRLDNRSPLVPIAPKSVLIGSRRFPIGPGWSWLVPIGPHWPGTDPEPQAHGLKNGQDAL